MEITSSKFCLGESTYFSRRRWWWGKLYDVMCSLVLRCSWLRSFGNPIFCLFLPNSRAVSFWFKFCALPFIYMHIYCIYMYLLYLHVSTVSTRRRTYVRTYHSRITEASVHRHSITSTNRHSDGIDHLTVAMVTAQRLVTAAADSNYKPTHANERFSFHYLELFLSLSNSLPSPLPFRLPI